MRFNISQLYNINLILLTCSWKITLKFGKIIYWSIIWVLFFSHIDKDAPSSPRIEQPPLYDEFTSREPPVFPPKIRALICPPFYVSTSVSISSFIFSRTTHSLSPADQAHCRTKRLAQCLCCACTHMYIIYIILFFISCTFLYVLFYFLIFITCFKFGNYLYRMFSNDIRKFCLRIDLINIEERL